MILELGVKLMESLLPQSVIALDQEGAERALGQRTFLALGISQRAELHVHIGQLREGIVIAVERGTAEREQAFLRFREHVRLVPPDFFQARAPFRECGIAQIRRECFVVDRLNFRNQKRRGFADLRHQILQLPHPREVIGMRAIFRQLQGSEVRDPLDFQV